MSRRASQLDAFLNYKSDPGLYHVREKLKDLTRRIEELEGKTVQGNIQIVNTTSSSPLAKHARTHASDVGGTAGLGTDPLDIYKMEWKETHTFEPTRGDPDEIPVTVKASGTDHTADIINIKEKNENDAIEVTADGLSKFLGATANATVNIKPGGASATQPDQLSIQPTWWFIADDIGQQNDTDVHSAPLHFGEFGQMTPKSNDRVKFFSNVVNGHASVKQPSTAGRLSVSGTIDETSGDYPGELNTSDTYTFFVVYNPTGATITPIIGSDDAGAEGIQVPAIGATQGFRVNMTDGGSSTLIASPVDTSGLTTIIAIVRRNGSNVHKIFCTTTGDVGQDLTIINQPVAGQMTLDALFQTHDGGEAPANTQILECAAWIQDGAANAYISDDDVNQLYNYAAQKYGLTQLSATGDILQCQDSTGTAQVTVDSAGFTGFGSDPTRRLEVEDDDGNAQFRIAYDSNDYCELKVNAAGEMIMECVDDGGAAAEHTLKIPRGASLPAAAAYDRELFITDGSVESLGNTLWIAMKKDTTGSGGGDTVDWLPLGSFGSSTGAPF